MNSNQNGEPNVVRIFTFALSTILIIIIIIILFHYPCRYDEAFPALAPNPSGPNSGPTSGLSSPGASNKWSQKMRIESNTVTSVFHIPFEERSDRGHSERFGEVDAMKACGDITKQTGAHIELSSSARDKSLTFLVTGKQVWNIIKLDANKISLALQTVLIISNYRAASLKPNAKYFNVSRRKLRNKLISPKSITVSFLGNKDRNSMIWRRYIQFTQLTFYFVFKIDKNSIV